MASKRVLPLAPLADAEAQANAPLAPPGIEPGDVVTAAHVEAAERAHKYRRCAKSQYAVHVSVEEKQAASAVMHDLRGELAASQNPPAAPPGLLAAVQQALAPLQVQLQDVLALLKAQVWHTDKHAGGSACLFGWRHALLKRSSFMHMYVRSRADIARLQQIHAASCRVITRGRFEETWRRSRRRAATQARSCRGCRK